VRGARRLASLDPASVGIRREDEPYAPSATHFAAANRRLAAIDVGVGQALERLQAVATRPGAPSASILEQAALVERQIDRARRAYGLFFDVFSQRGTRFAPALAACDLIATDCFQLVRRTSPGLFQGPLLKPLTYLEPSFSPATFRRGVMLRRLLGERNPFPLVRIPYERAESPWGMGVVLHEIGHNLQADLGVWDETRLALQRRVLGVTGDAWLTRIYSRWHREIFADLIALLLGGPASAHAMADFLAYPPSRAFGFRPLGVHPVPYLRVFILAQMLARMGFSDDAQRLNRVWRGLYPAPVQGARIPINLLRTAPRIIPHVVDEVAFQTRRGLGQKTLADVFPFSAADQARIQRAAAEIGRGNLPQDLPPRFAVSASRYAFERHLAGPEAIARTVLGGLARRAAASRSATTVSARAA